MFLLFGPWVVPEFQHLNVGIFSVFSGHAFYWVHKNVTMAIWLYKVNIPFWMISPQKKHQHLSMPFLEIAHDRQPRRNRKEQQRLKNMAGKEVLKVGGVGEQFGGKMSTCKRIVSPSLLPLPSSVFDFFSLGHPWSCRAIYHAIKSSLFYISCTLSFCRSLQPTSFIFRNISSRAL